MKRDSKLSEFIKALITAVIIVAIVKIFWSIVSLFLPVVGIDAQPVSEGGKLYYRYRLATDDRGSKRRDTPRKRLATIRDLKLLAVYDDIDNKIAVVEKRGRSRVLVKGDSIDGFKLVDVTADSAEFERGGKHYTIKLERSKGNIDRYQEVRVDRANKESVRIEKSQTSEMDTSGVVIIKRSDIERYTKNMDKIWKDISISEMKMGGKFSGFKVRYVRRGSFFQKIGLRRGDLIVAINGEEIRGYSLPMRKFKELDKLDGMTLTVIRKGERKELEYEIE